jgi:hypothetical protein
MQALLKLAHESTLKFYLLLGLYFDQTIITGFFFVSRPEIGLHLKTVNHGQKSEQTTRY